MFTEKNKNYNKYAYIEGCLSIVLNLFLFVLKYWAGIVSGSIAITEDAWHTLTDSFTSLIVIVGIKLSSIPGDEEHPFGHGKAELIGSIIIAVILAVVAGTFIIDSIGKLKNHEPANYGIIAIFSTIVSIIVKEALAQYAIWTGKKYNLKSLIADGWHHRSDSLSSIIILVGIFFNSYFWWIDGILGIVIAIILVYASYTIIKDAANLIIGEKPDDKLIENINNIVNSIHPGNTNIHHIHLHRYGNCSELTFHIRLPEDMSLYKAHSIASDIEKSINNKLCIETTIHIEPLKKKI